MTAPTDCITLVVVVGRKRRWFLVRKPECRVCVCVRKRLILLNIHVVPHGAHPRWQSERFRLGWCIVESLAKADAAMVTCRDRIESSKLFLFQAKVPSDNGGRTYQGSRSYRELYSYLRAKTRQVISSIQYLWPVLHSRRWVQTGESETEAFGTLHGKGRASRSWGNPPPERDPAETVNDKYSLL
jgi:hypothetical protein